MLKSLQILVLALVVGAAPSFVHAQTGSPKSVSAIDAEIGTANTGFIQDFSPTNPGADIPYNVRQVLLDIAASYLPLSSGIASTGVASIGGLTGAVGLGPGLGTASNNVNNTGVLSIGGVTGAVAVASPLAMVGSTIKISSPISLNLGGMGQSLNGATIGQVPLFPGNAGAASPADQCINIEAGGGTTAASDNTPAWNNVVSALAASPGGCIYFPHGQWTFLTNISYTLAAPAGGISSVLAHIKIKGDGPDATVLNFPSSNGLTINYDTLAPGAINQQGADIEDVTFASGAAGSYTGLTLQQIGTNAGSAAAPSNIINVVFRGSDQYAGNDYWGIGANVVGVANLQVGRSVFQGSPAAYSGIGLQIGGTSSSTATVVVHIYGTTFNYWGVGFQQGRFVQGVTIDGNTNFTGNATSIFVLPLTANSASYTSGTGRLTLNFSGAAAYTLTNGSPALVLNCASSQLAGIWPIASGANTTAVTVSATSGLGTLGASATAGCAIAEVYAAQLQINDDQFGQFQAGNSIVVESYDTGVQISNSLFGGIPAAINSAFIYLYAASNFNITGNQLQAGTTTGTYGINISNSGYAGAVVGTITGNNIIGAEFGVYLASTVSHVTTIGNRYLSNTFNVTDNGISDQVWDSPVGLSSMSLTGSPMTYTASSHPETIYFRGNTISDLGLGTLASSTTIATSVSATAATSVQLWPSESVTFHYTGSPTVVKDVH